MTFDEILFVVLHHIKLHHSSEELIIKLQHQILLTEKYSHKSSLLEKDFMHILHTLIVVLDGCYDGVDIPISEEQLALTVVVELKETYVKAGYPDVSCEKFIKELKTRLVRRNYASGVITTTINYVVDNFKQL